MKDISEKSVFMYANTSYSIKAPYPMKNGETEKLRMVTCAIGYKILNYNYQLEQQN